MSDTEILAVASRLHVLLRRHANRITDIVWMVANAEYAREVLRIVRAANDAEMTALADRFVALMPAAGQLPADEPRPSRSYIGSLR